MCTYVQRRAGREYVMGKDERNPARQTRGRRERGHNLGLLTCTGRRTRASCKLFRGRGPSPPPLFFICNHEKWLVFFLFLFACDSCFGFGDNRREEEEKWEERPQPRPTTTFRLFAWKRRFLFFLPLPLLFPVSHSSKVLRRGRKGRREERDFFALTNRCRGGFIFPLLRCCCCRGGKNCQDGGEEEGGERWVQNML